MNHIFEIIVEKKQREIFAFSNKIFKLFKGKIESYRKSKFNIIFFLSFFYKNEIFNKFAV